MAQVIAVTSGKGGVGKSTLTLGLGYALARRNQKVLLIDGDVGLRCLDHMLGISDQLLFDISDIVSGNCEPRQALYTSQWHPQLHLLSSSHAYERDLTPGVVQQLVDFLGKYYDYILIDAPAGLGTGVRAAVSAAHLTFVVATPAPISLRDAQAVRQAFAGSDRELRLLINRFSYRTFRRSKNYRTLDEVIDSCGIQLLGVLPEDKSLPTTIAKGQPFLASSQLQRSFERIAARLEGESIAIPLKKMVHF